MILLQEPRKPYLKKSVSDFLTPNNISLLAHTETEKPVLHEPRSLKEIMEKMGLVKRPGE
jgi:hypothetical protein